MDAQPLGVAASVTTDSLSRDSILECLRTNTLELQRLFGIRRIGLFGSFARETATTKSDVDLLVDFEQPIGLRFVELVEYLETLFGGRRVDVLTEAGLKGIRLPEVAEKISRSVIHV